MNYCEIKKCDIANGIGVRTTLFVSGCTNHCEECFQPQTWDFDYGKPFTEETEDELIAACKPFYINGLTLLGGEPFEPENQEGLLLLMRDFKERFPQKNIWCYTGFTLEQLTGKIQSRATGETAREMLKCIDILVDGKFEKELKNITLKFRGSENQRIIDMKKTLENGKITLYLE